MKKILLGLFRQYLFWILFFEFSRLVFILYYLRLVLLDEIPFREVMGIFWYSLRLDTGTACYFLIIPFFILLVQGFYPGRWLNRMNKIYTSFLIFLYSLASAGEMGIYAEWKTKLTYKVIKYLSHPSEIYNSAETTTFFILVLLFVLMTVTGILAYTRLFYLDISESPKSYRFSLAWLVLVPSILVVGMRGGVQQIPINQSQSYFSSHNILNIASVNNFFNLYISIFENLANFNRDPFVFMPEGEAARVVGEIYRTPADSTVFVLKNDHPNIVILILESWSADLIEELGGEPGITPEFKKLVQNGILFDNIYASGSRSEQGMACIFSGYPATPISSVTVQPDKFVKLPSLVHILKQKHYSTSYYFGGQLIYGNIKSYIIFNGFERIMEIYDFPESIPRGKLGIHDQYMLEFLHGELNRERQPFFSCLFTVSTHSPWDQPFEKPLKWGKNEREYINAAYYTDHCLGTFFRNVAGEPWFDNALFVIVADHSHNSYRNWHPDSREYHRIPLLFYGNAIRPEYRGTRIHKLGNQHDIPATLLAQLGMESKAFRWSKNLLNPLTPDFAYYANENGAGWIRPNGYFSFDRDLEYFNFIEMDPLSVQDSVVREGKAYLQELFREYMKN